MAQKQQAKHRELYDLKCRGAALDVGDLVLVKQTTWKGRHKIQDPPVHFGKVITHSSIVSEMSKAPTLRQTLFVSCMPNVIL